MPTQQFLEALRRQHTSTSELILILTGLALLVMVLLLLNQHQKSRLDRRKKRQVRATFLELCRDRGLTREEQNYLLHQGEQMGEEIVSLFQSNLRFDLLARQMLNAASTAEIQSGNALLSNLRQKLGYRPPSRGLALNSTRELPAGQTLWLVFPTDVFLEGTISEVDETKLEVKLIAGAPQKAALVVGMPVRLHFNRVSDARYSGNSYVLDLISVTDGMFLVLHHAEDLKRDQRRQDFRVDEDRQVSFWLISPTGEFLENPKDHILDRTPERATLSDLSGGGASLLFKRELPVHQRLYLNLDITGTMDLPLVRGTVIRAKRRGPLSCWAISVRFEDLRPSERQKLIRYVFMQERESNSPELRVPNAPAEETIKI